MGLKSVSTFSHKYLEYTIQSWLEELKIYKWLCCKQSSFFFVVVVVTMVVVNLVMNLCDPEYKWKAFEMKTANEEKKNGKKESVQANNK